jgi:predicted DNA-binding protein with PD1-like motif
MLYKTTTAFSLLAMGAMFAVPYQLCAQAPAPKVPEGYVGHDAPAKGLAPKMKVKESGPAAKTYELTFSRGDEMMSGMTDFAEKYHITSGHFTAIGAVDSGILGWSDPDLKVYKKIPITSESEVISMVGSIRMQNGHPYVHGHMVVGHPDGSVIGGHIVEAHVSLTLDVFVVDTSASTPVTARADQ